MGNGEWALLQWAKFHQPTTINQQPTTINQQPSTINTC
jgi:hypothetical protein